MVLTQYDYVLIKGENVDRKTGMRTGRMPCEGEVGAEVMPL